MFETRFNIKLLTAAILFIAAVLVFSHLPLPQEAMPFPLQKDGVDKLEHVLVYGLITFLFLLSLRTSPTMLSALLLFLLVSAIGAFDELTQPFVNRTANIADLVADIVGIIAVLFFSTMRRRWFLRPNS